MTRRHTLKGKILKPNNCCICDKTDVNLEGHHFNYKSPFNVIFCCIRCHSKIHHNLLTDEEKNKYLDIIRKKEGVSF